MICIDPFLNPRLPPRWRNARLDVFMGCPARVLTLSRLPNAAATAAARPGTVAGAQHRDVGLLAGQSS